jgi:hypothetical protein
MGGKFVVALQLEVAHHFIETCAWGRAGRFELPATFRATKTHKTLLLNPIQLSAHGLCRCSPTLSDCTLVPARRQGTKRRFAAAYRLNAEENRQPVLACRKMQKYGRSLHAPIYMVCRASYIDGNVLFVRNPISEPVRGEAELLYVLIPFWSPFLRRVAGAWLRWGQCKVPYRCVVLDPIQSSA